MIAGLIQDGFLSLDFPVAAFTVYLFWLFGRFADTLMEEMMQKWWILVINLGNRQTILDRNKRKDMKSVNKNLNNSFSANWDWLYSSPLN